MPFKGGEFPAEEILIGDLLMNKSDNSAVKVLIGNYYYFFAFRYMYFSRIRLQ